jgi:hypothetical protein
MKQYNIDPEEEDFNEEDLNINADEEYLDFNYPLGSKLKEDNRTNEDDPLEEDDIEDNKDR